MSRTLFTVAFVADCDDEMRAEILAAMEHQWSMNMLRVLAIHDLRYSDLAEAYESYGITASPIRERV